MSFTLNCHAVRWNDGGICFDFPDNMFDDVLNIFECDSSKDDR